MEVFVSPSYHTIGVIFGIFKLHIDLCVPTRKDCSCKPFDGSESLDLLEDQIVIHFEDVNILELPFIMIKK